MPSTNYDDLYCAVLSTVLVGAMFCDISVFIGIVFLRILFAVVERVLRNNEEAVERFFRIVDDFLKPSRQQQESLPSL
jgi:hypothetical protein